MNECTTIRLKALDQLLPRPDRARILGPTGPEILVMIYSPSCAHHNGDLWCATQVSDAGAYMAWDYCDYKKCDPQLFFGSLIYSI